MRALNLIPVIILALTVSACKNEIKCNDKEVLEVASKLALEKVSGNLFTAAFVDTEKTSVRFDSFRTRGRRDNQTFCVATINYDIAYKPLKTLEDRQFAAVFTSGIRQKSGQDVAYVIEVMDGGEDFTVEFLRQ